MSIKCEYCKSNISEYDKTCPNCGAENKNFVRRSQQGPKTIEELKQWYIDMELLDENITRFFIGKDYKGPKAFGIYKDENTGNFVVYKNKENGERAIRYAGNDEAFAVNELYQRLRSEIVHQKRIHEENYGSSNKKSILFRKICTIVVVALLGFGVMTAFNNNKYTRGYYNYNGKYYYRQSGIWYVYNGFYGWRESTDIPKELKSNYRRYYESSTYSKDYGTTDFSDSDYYKPGDTKSSWGRHSDESYDSSWDSSSSWDSGATDWSSDW